MTLLPDLSALRLLVDVARLGSIGAAAREAGISQQSASERLRGMEAQTGLVLLHRSPGGSAITPAGRLVVEWGSDLVQRADDVALAIRTLRRERDQQVRVHASMTTAEYLLPTLLVRLRAETGASARLRATNSDAVLEAVRAGHADVGFVEGSRRESRTGLSGRVVGGDRLVLVVAPGDRWSRRRSPLAAAEVSARPLTCREPGSGTRQVITDALTATGHAPQTPDGEVTTTSGVLAAVVAGGAPAFVSDRAALREVESGRLVVVPTELDLRRDFTAVWVGGRTPPAGPVRDLIGLAGR